MSACLRVRVSACLRVLPEEEHEAVEKVFEIAVLVVHAVDVGLICWHVSVEAHAQAREDEEHLPING